MNEEAVYLLVYYQIYLPFSAALVLITGILWREIRSLDSRLVEAIVDGNTKQAELLEKINASIVKSVEVTSRLEANVLNLQKGKP